MTQQDLDAVFAELVTRTRVALERSFGVPAPPVVPITDADLDAAESHRAGPFPPDLRAFYKAAGSGTFAFFYVVGPDDPADYDEYVFESIDQFFAEGLDDEGTGIVLGDPPTQPALVFGEDPGGGIFFVYELTGEHAGRIVSCNFRFDVSRVAWPAASSLEDFVRCVAELAEAGHLVHLPEQPFATLPDPRRWWEPDTSRDILNRNHCTGALYLSPEFD